MQHGGGARGVTPPQANGNGAGTWEQPAWSRPRFRSAAGLADAAALRRALAAFLGDAQYRKFIGRGMCRGRMAYWQEQAWSGFTAAHPEFAVGPDELAEAVRMCHLHGDELQPDAADVFHGNMDLARWYVEARNRLFPHAALDIASAEGRPFEGNRIGALFCPSFRAARAGWEASR